MYVCMYMYICVYIYIYIYIRTSQSPTPADCPQDGERRHSMAPSGFGSRWGFIMLAETRLAQNKYIKLP